MSNAEPGRSLPGSDVVKRWRLGIVGCGWAGEEHARALLGMSGRAVLSAVADIDSVRARSCADRWQVPVWSGDYHAILRTDLLDAVCICLPHQLHLEAALAAMRAGLDVLIEKPLANTLAEADAMIAGAGETGRVLMVAENVRYDPTYLTVAAIVRTGALGDLFLLRVNREHEKHQYMRDRPWWLSEPSGGILYAGGVHDFELVRMLGGEIAHVHASTGPRVLPEMAGDQNSVAVATLRSGAMAVLVETFSLKTPRPGVTGSVHGSRGSLWFESGLVRLYTAPEDGHPELVEERRIEAGDTFALEMAHFLDCLGTRQEPLTGAREERKPLVAVLAAYESLRTGQNVALS
jgi:UDP-N-acetylglucosamine 3-dehydrogenase